MTSISSAKEEDEHLEMDIDLSIRSQCSEKEDEHIEKMDTMISARLPENEHVIMGTTGSADSDDGVSQPSCSEEDEDSDNGSDSEADCFSTISLEDDAVHGEEEVELSSEIVRMKLCPGRGVSQDRVEEVERVSTFYSYVKPECDIWDQRCIDIHQIHPEDERVVSAHNIDNVWSQFKTWLNRHVAMSETIILIAWNGENCDLKWLWRITQVPRSRLSFPPQIQYFMDPYRVISSFKSCPLNKSKSKLDGYDLGSVWKFVNDGRNLNGAHNSLVDVKAQTDILISRGFVPFINYVSRYESSCIQPGSDSQAACQRE